MFKRVLGLLFTIVIPAVFLFLFTTFSHLTAATTEANVLIDAVLYDGLEFNDPDEAVRLRNVSETSVDISSWQLYDGSSKAIIPGGTVLTAGQTIWLAKDSYFFTRQFGFAPDFEVVDSSTAVPNLSGSWPGFANSGDEVILLDAAEAIVDVLVYEGGNTSQAGWSGTAVYHFNDNNSLFGEEGQILYRKRDQTSGLPVPDTDTAADWAQEMDDPVNGRKIMYPGWDLDTFFYTAQVTETAVLTIAVAPDNAYQALIDEISKATTSLDIESHTFENMAIKDALVQAANRGVTINILLEGAPPGGVPDQEKYICHELETAGAHCWFMISNDSKRINDRYKYIHAKFILIDGQKVIISSENLSPNSLPYDD
ncbi:MAG: phospholipase D-like domain-containing protein, partial [Anaerolineae bacterium]